MINLDVTCVFQKGFYRNTYINQSFYKKLHIFSPNILESQFCTKSVTNYKDSVYVCNISLFLVAGLTHNAIAFFSGLYMAIYPTFIAVVN